MATVNPFGGGFEGASMGTGIIGAVVNYFQTEELRKRDEERYESALALQREDRDQLVPRSRQLISDVTGGFRNLRTRSMNLIANTGRQERKDIAGAFGAQRRNAVGGLAGRGLSSGLFASGVSGKYTAQQRNALGASNQRFLNQKLSTDFSTTGAMLGAQSQLGLGNLQFENALTQQIVGTQLGHNEIQQANPFADISNLILANRPAPQPEQPSGLPGMIGGLATGAGSAYGGYLMAGAIASDINSKLSLDTKNPESFVDVDHLNTLEGVMMLPVSRWRYKSDPDTIHIGPMAQDFKKFFEVGDSDRYIAGVDAVGVLMSALKALATKVHVLETRYASEPIH